MEVKKMRNEQFEYGLETVVRVSKTKARHLYDAGKCVIMYTVYDDPESSYNCGFSIKKDVGTLTDRAFDAWVNEFEYYNCGNGRGGYAKFFVKVKDLWREKK